ncbi:hypothetical protein [Streptomyces mirabilis]|uniref:hypothetical protein n=1 Tax=Streptomyces mirabilis TaxID=68239 RepID=UPI003682083B
MDIISTSSQRPPESVKDSAASVGRGVEAAEVRVDRRSRTSFSGLGRLGDMALSTRQHPVTRAVRLD